MAERRVPWRWVLAGVGAVLLAALVGAWLWAMRQVVHGYYRAEYLPAVVTAAELGPSPAKHRLTDTPWVSEPSAVSASVSLQMLAAQQGRLERRGTLDFLMGFTWGASPIPGRSGFQPLQDPEPGLLRAAPALGFARRYLTCDRRDDFFAAVKAQLAKGRAVRVALDRATLLGEQGLTPHGVVLVGYDETGFEYYEPTCDDPRRCTPGVLPPGSPGLVVKAEVLARAVEALSLGVQYPWTYQLTVLEPSTAVAPALDAVLARNARGLLGERGRGPSTGAEAVLDAAKALDQHGDSVVTPEFKRALAAAPVVRHEDAATLVRLFPSSPALDAAAAKLDEAATRYAEVTQRFEKKEWEQASQALRAAAAADRAAGEQLLSVGPTGATLPRGAATAAGEGRGGAGAATEDAGAGAPATDAGP